MRLPDGLSLCEYPRHGRTSLNLFKRQIPVIGIDTISYGKITVTTWNILKYNLFGGAERGPDLYGTEPWYFYFFNLILNFNVLTILAILSLPALIVTHVVDYSRLGIRKHSESESSPYLILTIRLAPFYLWLLVLSLQPHKEERFMFPVYPLLCFNSAVALYLIRGWLDAFFTKKVSQYAVRHSPFTSSCWVRSDNYTRRPRSHHPCAY
jgi:alpha-1,2-mannosyltransferase